jgi:2-polyprenyl-3-methyl-5-hydroxy-6-metoxy-1,4-benzoquinol methylase
VGGNTRAMLTSWLRRVPFAHRAARALRRLPRRFFPLYPEVAPEQRMSIPAVERLDDARLRSLNELLDWQCFVVDARGRRFGNIARPGKRAQPQAIPDRRIALLDQRFPLRERHVLEFGCFEGIHTIALCRAALDVTALDARIENVAKTLLRSALFGLRPRVLCCDLERAADLDAIPQADVVHHVGVLYHLADPVTHLASLRRWARVGLMLDTHYAEEADATAHYSVGGTSYAYRHYAEGGMRDAFSGTADHSKWLTLPVISELLQNNGFADVEIVERRAERNGPRVLLFARRAQDKE